MNKMWSKIIKIIIKRFFSRSKESFDKSFKYWQIRYLKGGTSGSGSYGLLAKFKTDTINHFLLNHDVFNVVEFGCGDGNQISAINYPSYLGLDVSHAAIHLCKRRFQTDKTKAFMKIKANEKYNFKADLVVSLDVIFHLVEDDIFEFYMQNLFDSSLKYVIIYSSNFSKKIAPHVLSRNFTQWIELNMADEFKLIRFLPNKYPYDQKLPDSTSISDFYIYQRMK